MIPRARHGLCQRPLRPWYLGFILSRMEDMDVYRCSNKQYIMCFFNKQLTTWRYLKRLEVLWVSGFVRSHVWCRFGRIWAAARICRASRHPHGWLRYILERCCSDAAADVAGHWLGQSRQDQQVWNNKMIRYISCTIVRLSFRNEVCFNWCLL